MAGVKISRCVWDPAKASIEIVLEEPFMGSDDTKECIKYTSLYLRFKNVFDELGRKHVPLSRGLPHLSI